MDWFDITLSFLGTLCLLSLIGCIWDIFQSLCRSLTKKEPPLLYEILFEDRKVRSILAGIGLLICLKSGAETLLFWIPQDWMHNTEEGRMPYKESISTLFAFFATLFLGAFLEKATKIVDEHNSQKRK